jgi:HK97 family phage major capsid protein
MNRFEIELKALEKRMQERVDTYKAIYQKADDERRNLDEQEQATVVECHRALDTLKEERESVKAQLEELKAVDELGRSLGPAVPSVHVKSEPQDRMLDSINQWAGGYLPQAKTLGEAFVESKGYKDAIDEYRQNGGRFREGFSTGAVGLEAKGTLLEGAGGGGGALAATVPMVVPGEVQKLFQQLTVADLLMEGQSSTNSVRYVTEGTATSGAAGVAEGGTKPESALGLTTTDEPIKKIATILPVSEEMLEDAPAIQSYINGRLALFVRIEEERQLLRGTSGGNEVQGILTSRSVPVYAGGTAAGNKAEQLFKAINGLRGSAFLHPGDWEDLRLLKDVSGQLYGGGPFVGPYGGPQGPVSATGNQVAERNSSTVAIWEKPTYITAAIGTAKGTALVGTRSSAQVWRRGGLSVDATNSHSTYFQLNLIAIRAEERLGLAVYRPTGFVEVRLS